MVLSPMKYFQNVFDFFKLHFTSDLTQHVRNIFNYTHGVVDEDKTESKIHKIVRNSTYEVYEWQQSLTWQEVLEIQDTCKEAMKLWRYKLANSEQDFRTINPLLYFSSEIS